MVHTSNAIITATLTLSAAAPILAAPVGPRIDSGYSSVNNSAPVPLPQALATDEAVATPAPAPPPALEAPAKETSSSGVGDGAPATALYLTQHLLSRAGTADSDPSGSGVPVQAFSPISDGGTFAYSATESSSSGESSGSSTTLAISLLPLQAVPPVNPQQSPAAAPGTESSSSGPAVPPAPPTEPLPPALPIAPTEPLSPLPLDQPLAPLPPATGWKSSTLRPVIAQWSKLSTMAKATVATLGLGGLVAAVAGPAAVAAAHRDLDADELDLEARGVTPMDGLAFRQPTSSSSSSPGSLLRSDATLAGLTGLALAGRATAILAPILSAAHRRDLDVGTLRLHLGRDLEVLFARSSATEELD